jgi:MSHA biogenesis protein MshJ
VKALRDLYARINRASLRERSLLFVAALGLLAIFWNKVFLAPLTARRMALSLSLEEVRQGLSTTSTAQGQDGVVEQYAVLKSREAALASGIAIADAQLRDAQLGMIAPKQMVAVLTDVLGHQKDLTLILMRNLPVEPLLPPIAPTQTQTQAQAQTKNGSAPAADIGPYLHPVEMVVRGNYLNVLTYLKELESRPWGFQWRRFEFTTTADGPQYRIEFTTLSMQSNWLGV